MSLLPPTIMNDLELNLHGYKIFPMGPYYQAFPEGGSIKLYADDAKRNYELSGPFKRGGSRHPPVSAETQPVCPGISARNWGVVL
jgi:hypothetical protein